MDHQYMDSLIIAAKHIFSINTQLREHRDIKGISILIFFCMNIPSILDWYAEYVEFWRSTF